MRVLLYFFFFLLLCGNSLVAQNYYYSLDRTPIPSTNGATTYYVSSTGNDENSGTSEGTAWKTLAKVNSFKPIPGDQILFKRGDTFYGSINVENSSGTSGNPVVFGEYGNGTDPIITGFTTVSAWTNLGSNIWESANAVSTLSTCNMVVINGVSTAMGRYPNSGYLPFQSHSGESSITSSSLIGTPNWTGAQVVIRSSQWTLDRMPITNQSGGTLTYGSGITYTPTDEFGFFIQNDAKTLDSQNEWYYDSKTKKIQVYSTSEPTDVKVASVNDLLTIHSNYIIFNDITFQGANEYVFFNDWSTMNNLTIQNCSLLFSGMDAINFTNFNNITIENTDFENTNNVAINLRHDVTNLTVKNCTIKNTGIIPGMGKNGSLGLNGIYYVGDGLDVENNEITNTGYCGIYFTGSNIRVKNNYIDTFCKVLQDGAGIYTFRGRASPTTNGEISGNIILNGIGATAGTNSISKSFANGIYLDDNSMNISVTSNVVSNCFGYGIFIHNSTYIAITGNTVYNNGIQLKTQDDSNDVISNCTITDNIFISKSTDQIVAGFYDFDTPSITSIGTFDNNYYARPIDDNVTFFIDAGLEYQFTLDQWKTYSKQDANSHQSSQTITNENELQFEYNASMSAKMVNLSRRMFDVKGVRYAGSVILQPYTSIVLMKDMSAANND